MPIKFLIVEDEDPAAQRLARMVRALGSEYTVVHICEGVVDTINWLSQHQAPDIGLFDIQLADGVSFEIFKRFQVNFPVIFTTAYDEYALDALRLSAVDYLLKPINEKDLAAAIAKYRKSQQLINESTLFKLLNHSNPTNTQTHSRFKVQTGNHIKVISVNEIAYFNIMNRGVYLITHSGEKHLIDSNLDEVEKMIPQKDFFRINRQMIVCIDAIQKMTLYSKSRIKLELKPDLGIEAITSVERSAEFKKWLEG